MRFGLAFTLLLLWMFPAWCLADAVQERRLTISASIFPKLVALDQNLADKTNADGVISMAIVYVEKKEKAEDIARIVNNKVSKLAGISANAQALSLKSMTQHGNTKYAGILISETMNDKDLNKIIRQATRLGILLFSPFEGDIERGASSSIFVGARIRPYFNLTALKEANIQLKPAILRVSKTYE